MKWLFFSMLAFAVVASAQPPSQKPPKLPVPSQRFSRVQTAEEPSFRRHIIPAFSRLGCSGRECHGSFAGQGDFQLSLFGYDFDHDFKEITSDPDEIRIDPEHPEKSLILQKPTLEVSHKGKERIKKGSWEYNMLLKWVMSGAKNDTEKTGEFDRLEVFPAEIVFKKPGDAVQMRVLAHWKDGTVEDVTELARFRTNDESIAEVSETGRVEAKERGDTHVVAFYDNGVLPVPVMLPVSKKNGSRYPKITTTTKVDELIVAKLRKLGIVPSNICSDTEFLRRVSLDLAGTLPTPDEIMRFLANESPGKRAARIEELLDTPGYAAWWTTLLCDFSGNNPQQLNDAGGLIRNLNGEQSRHWYEWVYKRVAENLPYDELSAGIVLATSRTAEQTYEELAREMAAYYRTNNPADFAEKPTMPYFWARRNVGKPEEKALAFAHTWLGVRIECAQCHKHPFDQWTKQDFEQFQVFFNPIAYGVDKSRKPETMSYASLTDDIKAATADERVEKSSGDEKKDANKLHQQEAMRRIRAGELAPWNEVYVDAKRTAQLKPKKQQPDAKGSSRVFTPKILGGEEVVLNEYADPRQPLMDWMRDPQNPYFARAFVNRVWAVYFGRGIVEPADDMNLANPPVNAELLDYLATGFVRSGYNMKWLHREILNSDAYQRSWRPNETNGLDEKNFSRMVLRRLPAEMALDAITQATATTSDIAQFGADIQKRAIGPSAGVNTTRSSAYALTTFGKPARVANCDCERTADPTLLQTLFTRNDPELLARLESGKGGGWIDEVRRAYEADNKTTAGLETKLKKTEAMVREMQARRDKCEGAGDNPKELKNLERQLAQLKEKESQLTAEIAALPKPPAFNADPLIAEVFLRTVSRPPTAEEIVKAREDIAAASHPVNGLKDLLWAMLNTREFMVNH